MKMKKEEPRHEPGRGVFFYLLWSFLLCASTSLREQPLPIVSQRAGARTEIRVVGIRSLAWGAGAHRAPWQG